MNVEDIKKLRDETGAGITAVKEALEVSKGDYTEAVKYLREKGIAKSAKRKDNETVNGLIGTYVHSNRSLITFAQINCETDFASNSEDMIKFANDIALQIAANNPQYITENDINPEEMKTLTSTFSNDLEGKPENIKENIIKGRLQKHYEENVLMFQKLFVDDSKTVSDYLNELVAKIGEKIVISRIGKISIKGDIFLQENK